MNKKSDLNLSYSKFLRFNKKIIFKKKSKISTLVIDRGRFLSSLQASICASVKNKKNNHNIFTLISDPKNIKIIKFYKSFGENNLIYIRDGFFIVTYLTIISIIIGLYNFCKTKLFGISWFIENSKVINIKLGDLIYDSYIRHNHKYVDLKIGIKFLQVLIISTFKCLKISYLINKYNVKSLIINQDVMATNGAIAIRIGIKNNIKVIEPACNFKRSHYFIEHNKKNLKMGVDNFYLNYLRYNKKNFSTLKLTKKKIDIFLKKRLQGKIEVNYTGIIDLMNANKSPKIFSKKYLLKKLNVKEKYIDKIFLFAPHAFSDAPHGQGKNILFLDYYDHCKQTLQFIKKNKLKNILWVVRPHPTRIKYGEKKIFDNLFEEIIGHNDDRIKLCPDYINTLSLIEICDLVVTLKGTISIEFPCYGKKSITCSTTPFSYLGVTSEANSKKNYFEKIKRAGKEKTSVTTKQKKIAQKVLYTMENAIPSNSIGSSKILTKDLMRKMSSPLKDQDYALFCPEVIEKLRIYGFNNDNYYRDLYKIL
jgi:hypothetical protein